MKILISVKRQNLVQVLLLLLAHTLLHFVQTALYRFDSVPIPLNMLKNSNQRS
jgi:hypothetical protein